MAQRTSDPPSSGQSKTQLRFEPALETMVITTTDCGRLEFQSSTKGEAPEQSHLLRSFLILNPA